MILNRTKPQVIFNITDNMTDDFDFCKFRAGNLLENCILNLEWEKTTKLGKKVRRMFLARQKDDEIKIDRGERKK
jgi:hypothetical protein